MWEKNFLRSAKIWKTKRGSISRGLNNLARKSDSSFRIKGYSGFKLLAIVAIAISVAAIVVGIALSGYILSQNGQINIAVLSGKNPAAGASVYVYDARTVKSLDSTSEPAIIAGATPLAACTTDSSGRCSLTVSSGRYMVVASAQTTAGTLYAHKLVYVKGGDLQNVELRLRQAKAARAKPPRPLRPTAK